LRDQADGAGVRAAVGEGRVELAARAHDAEAVRAEQAQVVAARGIEGGAQQVGAARTHLGEAPGNHDDIARAGAAAGFDDAGHRLGLGADHREIEALRNALDRVEGILAEDLVMTRIDEEELALVTAVDDVAHERRADGALGFRSTDDGDRLRLEKRGEVMLFVVHRR